MTTLIFNFVFKKHMHNNHIVMSARQDHVNYTRTIYGSCMINGYAILG